jgi:hypothetical protein
MFVFNLLYCSGMWKFFGVTGIHISLKAERLFDLGPLHVTNSMLYGLVCAVLISAAVLPWSGLPGLSSYGRPRA